MTPPRPGPLCLRWVCWFRLWGCWPGGFGVIGFGSSRGCFQSLLVWGVVAAPAAATTVFGGVVGPVGPECGVCFCYWGLLQLLDRLPWVTNLVKFPRDVPQEGVLGSLTWGFGVVVYLLLGVLLGVLLGIL